MHSFSMRPAKYFYDKPLPKYLDPKTVLIYCPHPVCKYFVGLLDSFGSGQLPEVRLGQERQKWRMLPLFLRPGSQTPVR
jgi:hypothetical protein